MDKELNTHIWDKYQRGLTHHNVRNMFAEVEKCHNFYIGNQWEGISTEEELPSINFIKPICKYKISTIAQNLMSIVYSPLSGTEKEQKLCEHLNKYAVSQWERVKMDYYMWATIKNACITGDHYMYFFLDTKSIKKKKAPNPTLKMRTVNKTNIFLFDESNSNLNEQQWIIISERISVAKAIEIASASGLTEEEINMISTDDASYTQVGEKDSGILHSNNDKCTSLLFMRKTDKGIAFCRSVRGIIYQPEQIIEGLDVYPIVNFIWEQKLGSARGVGSVLHLIPNQLEVNKTLARRSVMTKRDAYNKLAYDRNKITNIDDLDKAGAKIEVDNLEGNPIDTIIQYLRPAPISSDAAELQNELISLTRNMEGASDAVTGQVDPTKTSGAAIKAVRDQSAVPLNEQVAAFKQFVEDVAFIWYRLWCVYAVDGISVNYIENNKPSTRIITKQELLDLDVDIKIDVSPVDPFSRLSQETSLERLLQGGYIEFEEYLKLLDQSSSVPKIRIERVLKERAPKGKNEVPII